MWSANIESKNFVKGNIQIGVIYSNATEKFTESFLIDNTDKYTDIISNRLAQLNALDISSIPVGSFVEKKIDTPVIVEIPPTSDEIFEKNVTKLINLKTLITLGVIDESNSDYQSLLKSAQDGYVNKNGN